MNDKDLDQQFNDLIATLEPEQDTFTVFSRQGDAISVDLPDHTRSIVSQIAMSLAESIGAVDVMSASEMVPTVHDGEDEQFAFALAHGAGILAARESSLKALYSIAAASSIDLDTAASWCRGLNDIRLVVRHRAEELAAHLAMLEAASSNDAALLAALNEDIEMSRSIFSVITYLLGALLETIDT